MQLRAANTDDVAAIQVIYAYHVRHGLSSFETEPPHYNEMRQRFASVVDAGFPYLVAVDSGEVLGYAYANHFRTRPAYRYAVEDSIYVRADATGKRIGTLLLNALIERCAASGLRQMLAVIGDSGNTASIAVHRRCGFEHVGTMRSIGRKFDRWVDVVVMQRALGEGAATAPAAEAR